MPGLLTAAAVGALPALAFPAPSLWWLAWLAVVPLLLVVRAAPTAWQGAARAWCGMAGYVAATQYWLAPSAGPALIGMGLLLGALWLPWGWAAHRMLSGTVTGRRALAAIVVLPGAWVLAEAARSAPGLGGPWALLGTSQWNQPVLLASAAVGGVWLTSVLIMAANTGVAAVLLCRSGRGRLVAMTAAAACVAVGPVATWLSRPTVDDAGSIRVALVQPGDIVLADERTAAAEALTTDLRGRRAELVVWGESSVGQDLASHPETLARLTELSRLVDAELLVNVDAPAPSGGIYKSAVLIGPDGIVDTYQKVRLVPFGEQVPLRPLLDPIIRHTDAAAEDRRRGAGPAVLHTDALTIGPLISFETTFPDLTRRQVLLGADLLAYQSSTSTYQGSWAQPQLAAMVAVRAVESGRPAVHAGLSGVSSAFDARGRQLAWLPADVRGATVVEVPLTTVDTGYRRLGDWPLAVAAVVLAGAGIRMTVRRPQPR
ncbi:apolipoprotein N-acyltransferase [Mycolicibacterium thermoresistibile]